ncbi:siderophore-interacting protein [Corynebacterium provencense]|uniref:siderophore-interacting protein n=1 Tax=Corynebacterium provencense TaxID=1737425 RepID=UPI000833EF74|nr:SIP domain-containing protein [Corynebacterium provencense]
MNDTPDATTVNALLNSDRHRAGLNDLTFEVTSVTRRYPWLARVSGRIPGMADTDPADWSHPNLAVRLAVPDADDALGPLIGQAGICRRVYTLANVDTASSTADIDIVVHGSTSPMMRWLTGLTPGDTVDFSGPRPHPAPTGQDAVDPAGRIHLLADGSAYPAASAIARSVPGIATVVLALPDRDPQTATYSADFPGAQIIFAGESDTPLADALADLDTPATDTVWAAGEREDIRAVRALSLKERKLPRSQVQVFGYWRRGKTGTDTDLARLQGVARMQAEGRELTADDDFEIEI